MSKKNSKANKEKRRQERQNRKHKSYLNRLTVITIDHALMFEDDVFNYEQSIASNIKTVDDLLKYASNNFHRININLGAQGNKKIETVIQFHAIALSMLFNMTNIKITKDFLDELSDKNAEQIMHDIRLGNSMRFAAKNLDLLQFNSVISEYFKNNQQFCDYKDFYLEIEK